MSAVDQENGHGIIQAAGGLVWRVVEDVRQIAVVHRPKYDDWTLPKGKLKKRETWQEGARREVEEEIQCEVEVGRFAGCSCYTVNGAPKVVLYWHMEPVDCGEFQPNDEIDRVAWLPVDQAVDKLDYDIERELLQNQKTI